MKSITITFAGTAIGIAMLKNLKGLIQDYYIMHATGSGSGDVVQELAALSGVVSQTGSDLEALIDGTVACLENYLNQMIQADEYIAESLAGDGK